MDMSTVAQLEHAIDTNDVARVQALMTHDPTLHGAPLGYGKDGPLTWVAECRVPWEPPGPARLAMAAWMIQHGSDVHQGGDGPLMRAALNGYRIPMMELLVSHGADVNALWHGHFPIVFAPCESWDPEALAWLLDHGADPNRRDPRQVAAGHPRPDTRPRLPRRVVRPWPGTAERLHRRPARGRWHDAVRHARRAAAAARPARRPGRADRRRSRARRQAFPRAGLRHDRRAPPHAPGRNAPARGRGIRQPPRRSPCSSTAGPTSMPARRSTRRASAGTRHSSTR